MKANKMTDAQLARLEKNLRSAAELGSALALLGREILRDVKSAEIALAACRQSELPLPAPKETPAESRAKRYEANTKKVLGAFVPRAPTKKKTTRTKASTAAP